MTSPHGSSSAYFIDRCRCDVCKLAQFRRAKTWRRKRHLDPMVDAAPAYERLREWEAEGFALRPVAAYSGLKRVAHDQKHIHRSLSERILAVTRAELLANLPDGARVPNIGSHRRVKALVALGHTHESLGVTAKNASSSRSNRVTAAVHRQVAALYDQLAMTPGTSERGKKLGKHLPPPLAWDDDAIDDPEATAAQWIRTAGTDLRDELTERREAIAKLTKAGLSAAEIADRLQLAPRTIERHRKIAS